MAHMHLEVVTPEAKIFSGEVDSVLLPGIEGELGILPGHIPLMTQIKPGELRIVQGGQARSLAVGGGFAEVDFTKVSVLTDNAVDEKDIDEKKCQEAIERAKAAQLDKTLDAEDLAAMEAAMASALTQLMLKKRRG